jgi:hypothetical protein
MPRLHSVVTRDDLRGSRKVKMETQGDKKALESWAAIFDSQPLDEIISV